MVPEFHENIIALETADTLTYILLCSTKLQQTYQQQSRQSTVLTSRISMQGKKQNSNPPRHLGKNYCMLISWKKSSLTNKFYCKQHQQQPCNESLLRKITTITAFILLYHPLVLGIRRKTIACLVKNDPSMMYSIVIEINNLTLMDWRLLTPTNGPNHLLQQ